MKFDGLTVHQNGSTRVVEMIGITEEVQYFVASPSDVDVLQGLEKSRRYLNTSARCASSVGMTASPVPIETRSEALLIWASALCGI